MSKVCVILGLAVCLWHWLRGVRKVVALPFNIPIAVAFSIGVLAVAATGVWH